MQDKAGLHLHREGRSFKREGNIHQRWDEGENKMTKKQKQLGILDFEIHIPSMNLELDLEIDLDKAAKRFRRALRWKQIVDVKEQQ